MMINGGQTGSTTEKQTRRRKIEREKPASAADGCKCNRLAWGSRLTLGRCWDGALPALAPVILCPARAQGSASQGWQLSRLCFKHDGFKTLLHSNQTKTQTHNVAPHPGGCNVAQGAVHVTKWRYNVNLVHFTHFRVNGSFIDTKTVCFVTFKAVFSFCYYICTLTTLPQLQFPAAHFLTCYRGMFLHSN